MLKIQLYLIFSDNAKSTATLATLANFGTVTLAERHLRLVCRHLQISMHTENIQLVDIHIGLLFYFILFNMIVESLNLIFVSHKKSVG